MKLLAEFENAHEADLAAMRYREKGILTYVSSRHSNSFRVITGATQVGLWVVLDDQYSDAVELRKNDSHQPSIRLSEEEMLQLEELGRDQLKESGSKMLSALAYTVIVTALAVYIFYVSHSLLNSS